MDFEQAVRQMHQSTGSAFDQAAERYEDEVADDIAFLSAGGENFCEAELPYLDDLAAWCGRAIHLQCAGGRDTLSLWNRGAREVVGVDISPRMIRCAQWKSAALGAPAAWHCCDVLETPASLNGTADLVYTGRGALCWVLDLAAWAAVVARLLRPGGYVYIFEGHPLCWILDHDAADLRLDSVYGNYFLEEPVPSRGWPVGYVGELELPVDALATKYERQWNLGEVVTALIAAGLRLERLEEHAEAFYEEFPHWPAGQRERLPQTYSVLAQKPG